MNGLTRIRVWCKRFRYRKGYGVHSPFAFSFIKGVIHENTPYYAYQHLEKGKCYRPLSARYYARKYGRLLFRLANAVQPQTLMTIDATPYELEYLRAGCKKANAISLSSDNQAKLIQTIAELPPIDLLYIADSNLEKDVLSQFDVKMRNRSMIIVKDVRCKSKTYQLWRQILIKKEIGVSFDLYYAGIAFFKHEIDKQEYIVNF